MRSIFIAYKQHVTYKYYVFKLNSQRDEARQRISIFVLQRDSITITLPFYFGCLFIAK